MDKANARTQTVKTITEGWSVIVMVGTDESTNPPAAIQVKAGTYLSKATANEAGSCECDKLKGHGFWIQSPAGERASAQEMKQRRPIEDVKIGSTA